MFSSLECLRIAPRLWEYAAGRASAAEVQRMEQHVHRCARCAARLQRHRQTLLHLQEYREQLPSANADWPALSRQMEALASTSHAMRRTYWAPGIAGVAAAGVVVLALIWAGRSSSRDREVAIQPPPSPRNWTPNAAPAVVPPQRSAPVTMAAGSTPPAPPQRPGQRLSTSAYKPSPPTQALPPGQPPKSPLSDEEYLDGSTPEIQARWLTGRDHDRQLLAWLKRLPPVKDDFVEVPLPRLASADPKSPAASDAVKKYEGEAKIIDARLFRKVTIQLKASSLAELCGELSRQTSVHLSAARGVAEENVTALLEERPAREVMRGVARLFGYKWSRSGEEGKYRYELQQDLRSQLAEEEMRNRDLHEALIALDEQMGKYQPYLGITPEEAATRAETANPNEKPLLQALTGKGWGAAQLYFRLSPAQRLALASGQTLTFSSNSATPALRLPAEFRRSVLASTHLTIGTFEGSPAIVERGFGEPGAPLSNHGDATAEVTLSMGRSELGELTLHGHSQGGLEDETGLKKMIWAGDQLLSQAKSPSVAKPDNATANAALKNLPEFKRVVTLKPKPSCPWFSPETKPEDRAGFELENNGRMLSFGPDGGIEEGMKPHVTAADAWEAVHQATGLPILADSYLRVYEAGRLTAEKKPLFEGLSQVGDEMGVRWRKDGEFLLARSTSYFWDKLKEVPVDLLRRWQTDRKKGSLPLNDLLEMSTLSDSQLDSKIVGYVIGHCWNLEEWGIVGSGGAFRVGLPGGAYMRRTARFLAMLNPVLRDQAQRTGVLASDLPPAQREALAQVVAMEKQAPEAMGGLRFRVEYAPLGTYLWMPVVATSKEAEQLNGRWPFVAAETAEAALAMARKYNPAAQPDQIRRSRGALVLSFQNARGESWHMGGPGVAFGFKR